MSFLKYLVEASDSRKKSWKEATSKRRNKLKESGLYEGRFWIKETTNKGLQKLKSKLELKQVGEVIDKLVEEALKK